MSGVSGELLNLHPPTNRSRFLDLFWVDCDAQHDLTIGLTPITIRSYMHVLPVCSLQYTNTRTLKTLNTLWRSVSFRHSAAYNWRSISINMFVQVGFVCITCHSKPHPISIQTLYRIHDVIFHRFEIASEVIFGIWGKLTISQVALRSLGDFVFACKTRNLFLT